MGVQKEEASIPDMASLFDDETKAPSQFKPQEPWTEQRSWSASTDMANFFATGFDGPPGGTGSFNLNVPAKSARDMDSHTNDMTNLFGSSSSNSAASVEASASASGNAFGWP